MTRNRQIIPKFFLSLFPLLLSGCEVTAAFYVDKSWALSPGYTAANPDMKTKASIEVKLYDSQAKRRAVQATK